MEYRYNGQSLKSGIYKITNKINGRVYIGSAKEFKERWKEHTYSLRHQRHSNKFLQADYNKCGEEAFLFEVIEETEGMTKKERLVIEENYIKQHYDGGINCYNLCNKAVSREGSTDKNPEITKAKRSKASKTQWENSHRREKHKKDMEHYWQSKEAKAKHHETLLTQWNNEIFRRKMSERMSGENNTMYGKIGSLHPKFGVKHSEETKRKQAIGRSKPIRQYTKNGEFVAEYYGAKEASRQTNITYIGIVQAANGKAKTAGGYVWRYTVYMH